MRKVYIIPRKELKFMGPAIPGLLPNAFAAHNGISIVKSSQDEVEAALTISETSLNPYGSLHGGAYYTLADAAGSSLSRMDGRRYVTLRGELDFISSVSSGKDCDNYLLLSPLKFMMLFFIFFPVTPFLSSLRRSDCTVFSNFI